MENIVYILLSLSLEYMIKSSRTAAVLGVTFRNYIYHSLKHTSEYHASLLTCSVTCYEITELPGTSSYLGL